MNERIKKALIFISGLVAFVLFAAWLLLSSSIFATTRGNLVARVLSDKLDQDLKIAGGVSIDLGSVLHITAKGVALPSHSMTDVNLAEIGQFEFDLALSDLLKRNIEISNLQAAETKIALLVDQDGTTSWSENRVALPGNPGATPSGENNGHFLAGLGVQLVNSGVTYKDEKNGWELDLVLAHANIGKNDASSPVTLSGDGALNGEKLSLSGTFPEKQPFHVTADFSQIKAVLEGTPDQGGYSTAVSVTIAELGQLLDVLKLEKSVSGKGHVNAVFKSSADGARVEDLDVLVSLDGGQSLVVQGDVGKLGDSTDVTLDTKIRLYSEENRPPATRTRRDLKLIGIDMQLIAQPNGIPKRGMVIETNGFVLDTSGEGPPPISFSKISRTPDSHLKIGEVILRIGPPEANFLVLEGAVEDALGLDGIDVKGTLSIPLASLVAPEKFQTSDVLGKVVGGFYLKGNLDALTLTDLKANAEDNDLWHLDVNGSVQNVLRVDGVELDIAADIPSGADLLNALTLEPIETGPVKLTTKLSSDGTEWNSQASVSVAESRLGFNVLFDVGDPNPVVRGKIESDLIRIENIRDIVMAAIQLAKLEDLEKTKSADSESADDPSDDTESKDGKRTEPLVMPKPGDADRDLAEDKRVSDPPGPFRNVTLHPLGRAVLLSGMDLDVDIDLRKIEGKKGTSNLHTDLELKDQKARLGPMKLEYGGGNFEIGATMDMAESPGILKVSGSTGGWDFGKIMQELRIKIQARGVLNASFDVSGSHASIRDFLASMNGGATVSLEHGSIDTALLDIAGLGVIPWLFSKDRGKTAAIVCAVAPLQISGGRISTKQTVMETDQVQIVVFGNVDMNNRTMDISGQPRRIGKPLSRSPWPFTAVGSVTKPKITVKDGPRRLRRSDGASTMPQRRKLCVPDILQLQ